MRLEIHETVSTPDHEMVLRALEMCSRDVASDVVRESGRLTLYGLGPSPRMKNRRDVTVFHVNAAENRTQIHGEVNFQASALLGDQPQDEIVREKLERLFDQVKMHVSFSAIPMAAPRVVAPAASVTASASAEESLPVEEAAAAEVVATVAASEEVAEISEALVTSEESEAAVVRVKATAETLVEPALPAMEIAIPKAEIAIPKAEIVAPKVEIVAKGEEREWAIPLAGYEVQHRGVGERILVAVLALLLLVPAGYLLYRHFGGRLRGVIPATTPEVEPAPEQPATKPLATVPVLPAPQTATPPAPQMAADAKEAEAGPEHGPDPRIWLRSWAAAMGTRNASAQAAFYADTVDQYMGQHNVDRDAVMRDREATINMRKSPWTLRIQQVAVLEQTDTDVKVRLVKHFIEEPETGKLEWFVPSEMELKKVNGDWKIISERDLARTRESAAPEAVAPEVK